MKNHIIYLISITLFAFSSCSVNTNDEHAGHNHSKGQGHNNTESLDEHEHANSTLTLFSDKTELFVEYHPLIVGRTTTFINHLTKLETYKPYKNASITVKLENNNTGIKNTSRIINKNNTLTTKLTPKKSGIYKLIFHIKTPLGEETFTAKTIEVYSNEKDAKASIIDKKHTSFLKEQAWNVDFSCEKLENSFFYNIVKTTGEIISPNKEKQQLTASTSGKIHFISNNVIRGKNINRNECLFLISGKNTIDDNIDSKYRKAKIDIEQARINFHRAENLVKDKIISEKEFINSKAELQKAEIYYNSINKNYSNKGIKIKSPINGFINNIFVSEGEYVQKGQIIALVNSNNKLLLRADIYQKHLSQLNNFKSANFKLSYTDKIFDTKKLNGKKISFAQAIDDQQYTSPLFFEIDKPKEVFAGSFAEIFLKSKSGKETLNISKSAILEDQGVKYVFVQITGESYEKRYIKIGKDNGLKVEIISGLKEGERVVNKGAYFVKLAELSSALPAHNHSH